MALALLLRRRKTASAGIVKSHAFAGSTLCVVLSPVVERGVALHLKLVVSRGRRFAPPCFALDRCLRCVCWQVRERRRADFGDRSADRNGAAAPALLRVGPSEPGGSEGARERGSEGGCWVAWWRGAAWQCVRVA